MADKRLVLTILGVERPSPHSYRVRWAVRGDTARLCAAGLPLEVNMGVAVEDADFFALQTLLASVLPAVAYTYGHVVVELPCQVEPFASYWNQWLSNLRPARKARMQWVAGPSTVTVPEPKLEGRIGLFFGGGVQSLYTLSKLECLHPTLLSIAGPKLMNHSRDHGGVRDGLMHQLVVNHNVPLVRITTNCCVLLRRPIGYWVLYIGGPAFYWLAAPAAHVGGMSILMHEYELEYVWSENAKHNRGLSMGPLTQQLIPPAGWPRYMSPYTAISMAQQIRELAATPYLKYMFSCFNDGERWCGKCAKCRSRALYMNRLRIPRARIGMSASVPALGRDEALAGSDRIYWKVLDLFYPAPQKPGAKSVPAPGLVVETWSQIQSCNPALRAGASAQRREAATWWWFQQPRCSARAMTTSAMV